MPTKINEMPEDDPNQVDEVERIKWYISRIDLAHKINLESIENSKRIFENVGAKSLSKLKSKRKEYFTVLGVALTIILGVNSFTDVPEWLTYLSLSILSGIALILYLIFNYGEKIIDESFDFLEILITDERILVAQSQAFTASNFADLAFIKLKNVQNYGVFTVLLGIALVVDIEKRVRKYSDEHSAWRIDLFGADFDENKTIIKQAPDLLKRFDRDDVYPAIGFDLIEKLLVKDSKKLTDFMKK